MTMQSGSRVWRDSRGTSAWARKVARRLMSSERPNTLSAGCMLKRCFGLTDFNRLAYFDHVLV